MWRREWMSAYRASRPQSMTRVVVAIDPPMFDDRSGFVVAGLGDDGIAYVLLEQETDGDAMSHIKQAAAVAHEHGATIAIEHGRSFDQIASLVRHVFDGPVAGVRMKGGRWFRSEPVAMMYAEDRLKHVGIMPRLEYEMVAHSTAEPGTEYRVLDALLAAAHHLLLQPPMLNIRAI